MVIRLDKCSSFGMSKRDGVFQQIDLALFVNQEKIPSIPIGSHFIYLGKIYDFHLNNERAKEEVQHKLLKMLKTTSDLRISVHLKLKILKTYIHSQLTFELRLYNFGSTWIEDCLDMVCANQVREWLNMPPSGCVKEMLAMPKYECGLGIPSFLDVSERLWLRKRYHFKNSAQLELQQLWNDSSRDHVRLDAIISNTDKIATASSLLRKQQLAKKREHFLGLQMQGEAPRVVTENISRKNIVSWNDLADHLPQYLFRFLRKALQQLLPTASNLFRWKIATSPTCTLCMNKPQSNAHVLSNCSAPKALERYTLRHNAILSILACWITSTKSKDQQLFADLPLSTCSQIADIFLTCVRPDLVLVDEKIHVLELTVCHENNLAKSRQYKQNKYSNISDHLDSKFVNYEVELFTIEVSVLGFISDISDFCADAKLSQMPDYIKTEISKSAINNSYNIYRLRNRND